MNQRTHLKQLHKEKAMNHNKIKTIVALLVGLSATAAALFLLSSPNIQAATLTVNSTADSGSDTLRQRLLDAQGDDTIIFNLAIFPQGASATITLTSGRLPDIDQGNITIDGSGAEVIIDGSQLSSVYDDGLRITSNNNTIKGLTIQNFRSDGVDIRDGAQGNKIENCIIRDNHKRGVYIWANSKANILISNTIITNSEAGVQISGTSSISNTITHNSITGNAEMGILLSDSGNAWITRPLIHTVVTGTARITATGQATPTAVVEVFADPGGEGLTFLGQTTADATGAFTLSVTGAVPGNDNVTATATDADGNTSEFGCYPLPRPVLVWPLSGTSTPGGEFSSPYGPRLQASRAFTDDWHRGLDITATVGISVYAVADGVVRWAEKQSSSGGLIVQIDHESGAYFSTYIHLTQTNVITGQSVNQGDVIGYSGTSGSGFPHLHFEIRECGFYQRHAVNPFLYLPYTDTVQHTVAFSAVETAPPVGDSVLVTATVVVTAPRDELDFNVITLEVKDADGNLLDRRSLDFHAHNGRTLYPMPPNSDPLDTLCMDEVCIIPARFNTSSDEYRITFTFGGMQGHCRMTLVASAVDVHQNVVSATYIPSVPCLTVTKQVDPDSVQESGSSLTYTIRVTNTGNVTLIATATDTLPAQVTPTGVLTWLSTAIAPDSVWTKQFTVTAQMGYSGTLTNVVQVTTDKGATGVYTKTATVLSHFVCLPVVLIPYVVTQTELFADAE